MDKTELIVWCSYGTFVVLGLLVFIGISCYVKTKIHICEEEQLLVRRHNKLLAYSRGKSDKNNTTVPRKETFSLFNLLS